MPEQHREAILLELEGNSIAEVAKLTGAAENTTRTRLFRAKKKLKEGIMKRMGADVFEDEV